MNEYTLSWGGVQGPRKEAASREDMEEEEELTGRGQREAMGRGTGRSDSWDGCREDMPTFQGSSVFISTERPPFLRGLHLHASTLGLQIPQLALMVEGFFPLGIRG